MRRRGGENAVLSGFGVRVPPIGLQALVPAGGQPWRWDGLGGACIGAQRREGRRAVASPRNSAVLFALPTWGSLTRST